MHFYLSYKIRGRKPYVTNIKEGNPRSDIAFFRLRFTVFDPRKTAREETYVKDC